MKSNVETICDDNGFEILVGYDYEESPSQIEEGHGTHEVGKMIYTNIKSVELVVAGRGIELISLLSQKEAEFIKSKLTFEE